MQNPTEGWLSIADAAQLAGVKSDAIRKRISRRKVDATKIGGRWYVNPDSLSGHVQSEPDKSKPEPDTSPPEEDQVLAIMRELVESQRKTIDTLTGQLEEQSSELRAMHVHIERLTRALPAPTDETTENHPRRKWRWWPW